MYQKDSFSISLSFEGFKSEKAGDKVYNYAEVLAVNQIEESVTINSEDFTVKCNEKEFVSSGFISSRASQSLGGDKIITITTTKSITLDQDRASTCQNSI